MCLTSCGSGQVGLHSTNRLVTHCVSHIQWTVNMFHPATLYSAGNYTVRHFLIIVTIFIIHRYFIRSLIVLLIYSKSDNWGFLHARFRLIVVMTLLSYSGSDSFYPLLFNSYAEFYLVTVGVTNKTTISVFCTELENPNRY